MRIDEYLRNRAFKVVDTIRNEPIQKYVKELQAFEEEEDAIELVNKKLNNLLSHAQEHCTLYHEKKGKFELGIYPVVNKKYLANYAESIYAKGFAREKLVKVCTSGSYGTPFLFHLTPEKKKRQQAEVIYYGKDIGYKVGTRHAYFRTALSKGKFKLWLQNEMFISAKALNNDFFVDARHLLKKKKFKILIGFPSAIAVLAQYCIDKGDSSIDFDIKGVLTFAENLTVMQRNCISQAFGCKVYSRYGTEELGILGCQHENNSDFLLNTCNYIIEVLKLHEDKSVLPGEIGRVVVTDLHSDAFPLIRYETGDLAVLGEVFKENKGWAKSLKCLSGRVIQMLNATNGEKLYPLFFENIIEKLKFFAQYQLIQETAKNFTLKLVPKTTFNVAEFAEVGLIIEMRNWLGADAHINIQLVNDIEMLPSGKRPSVINKLANV